MIENEEFSSWFKENTPKEGLSENTTFTRQFLIDAWDNGYINGYNKANEWHYPSKGELPKCDEETQLMFYVNCYYNLGDETITIKRTVLGYYKKSFLRDDVKLFAEKSRGYEEEHLPQDVIAWKEIVLPEPPKYWDLSTGENNINKENE